MNNRYYSYRNLITKEVYKISDYIGQKSQLYRPYIMEW